MVCWSIGLGVDTVRLYRIVLRGKAQLQYVKDNWGDEGAKHFNKPRISEFARTFSISNLLLELA